MLKGRKLIVIAVVAFVLLIVLFYAWSSYRNRTDVSFQEIKLGEVAPPTSCSGVVSAQSADLSSTLGGRITWIGVDVGSRVKVGDVLVKFDGFDSAKREYESISSLYAQGLASKNQLDAARVRFEASGLISPIAGVVVSKKMRVGEVAPPGMAVVSVANPAKIWIDVEIDEMDIGGVKEGVEARIFCDAYPDDVFVGRVAWISRAAERKEKFSATSEDEDKIFRSKVTFSNDSGKLRPGMTVDVDIITLKKSGVIVAPRDAIIAKDSKNAVFVLRGGRVEERVVEIGLKDMTNVEILNGLKVGERVAVTSIDKLKNRTRVRPQR